MPNAQELEKCIMNDKVIDFIDSTKNNGPFIWKDKPAQIDMWNAMIRDIIEQASKGNNIKIHDYYSTDVRRSGRSTIATMLAVALTLYSDLQITYVIFTDLLAAETRERLTNGLLPMHSHAHKGWVDYETHIEYQVDGITKRMDIEIEHAHNPIVDEVNNDDDDDDDDL